MSERAVMKQVFLAAVALSLMTLAGCLGEDQPTAASAKRDAPNETVAPKSPPKSESPGEVAASAAKPGVEPPPALKPPAPIAPPPESAVAFAEPKPLPGQEKPRLKVKGDCKDIPIEGSLSCPDGEATKPKLETAAVDPAESRADAPVSPAKDKDASESGADGCKPPLEILDKDGDIKRNLKSIEEAGLCIAEEVFQEGGFRSSPIRS